MVSSSASTARSHNVTWWSSLETAKTESSEGCHSIDVIGPLCHSNLATSPLTYAKSLVKKRSTAPEQTWPTYCDCRILRRSHTLVCPSSSPLRRRYDVDLFQLMTLMSDSCAALRDVTLWRALDRMSHNLIVLSTEHEANTVIVEGLH